MGHVWVSHGYHMGITWASYQYNRLCHMGTIGNITWAMYGYHMGITWVSHGHPISIIGMSHGYHRKHHMGITWASYQYHRDVTWVP